MRAETCSGYKNNSKYFENIVARDGTPKKSLV
jgi:hypothetical protein